MMMQMTMPKWLVRLGWRHKTRSVGTWSRAPWVTSRESVLERLGKEDAKYGHLKAMEEVKAHDFLTEEMMFGADMEERLRPQAEELFKLGSALEEEVGEEEEEMDGDVLRGFVYHIDGNTAFRVDLKTRKKAVLATPRDFMPGADIQGASISGCDRYVTLLVKRRPGDEWYMMTVKDMKKGKWVDHQDHVHSAAWIGSELFYTTVNDRLRSSTVYHKSANNGKVSKPQEVFHENEESFFVDVRSCRNNECLMITSTSKTSTEVRIVTEENLQIPKLLRKRQDQVRYFVETSGGYFWILSNRDQKNGNYKLFRVPVSAEEDDWELVKANEDTFSVEDMEVFHDLIVTYERRMKDGLPIVRTINVDEGSTKKVLVPGKDVTEVKSSGQNLDFKAKRFSYVETSPILPQRTCTVQFSDDVLLTPNPGRQSKTLSQLDMVRLNANGEVPITLTYRKGMKKDGSSPLLLLAYGAYGINLSTTYEHPIAMMAASMGWIVAHAHVRGGCERGREWYEQGKLNNKTNTFLDIITVTEELHKMGWSKPALTTSWSLSAGGMAMAVVANTRPDLFKAMVLRAPFLDVVGNMMDPKLPLTVPEYDEWGNPSEDDSALLDMASYDPILNLEATGNHFPSLFITCDMEDLRVPPYGILKYVAKFRELYPSKPREDLILYLTSNEGHSYGDEASRTLEYAYLWSKIKNS